MKLYSGPLSLFSRKVEIGLREKGLGFERVMVDFSQAAGYHPKHPDVLKHNPKGQVPVFIDDDLVLFDSTQILEYLDHQYPTPSLLPKDPKARARCRLLELSADEILLPLVAKLMYRNEPPGAGSDPKCRQEQELAGAQAEKGIEALYENLDQRLNNKEYFFEDFSVADIAMFMTILFSGRLSGPSLIPYHHLHQWYKQVGSRASVEPIVREVADADRELTAS